MLVRCLYGEAEDHGNDRRGARCDHRARQQRELVRHRQRCTDHPSRNARPSASPSRTARPLEQRACGAVATGPPRRRGRIRRARRCRFLAGRMSGGPVVLDAAGLIDLAQPGRRGPSPFLRALLETAWERDREVLTPAVVCAEVCRGQARTRAVEALLARHSHDRSRRSPIRVMPTTFDLARTVGTILHVGRAGSEDLVDAHLIALCLPAGGGIVVTSDPDDVARLAAPFPGLRIVTRAPRLP